MVKTVDQYFAGSRNAIQNANVGLILDSVIAELQLDKNRKFIYVEIAFFVRWWRRQSQATKRIVRQLVAEGRLEFINAGWVMNDEAATLYTDIIDQHTAGALKIATEFSTDASPRVGWQIDPFGHSSFQNKAFREMCFDGWLVGRADAQDMAIREATGALEMVIPYPFKMDGVKVYRYSPPTGFNFDVLGNDPPVQDDPMLEDVNVTHRLDSLRDICLDQAKSYNPVNGGSGKSQNIILTMGMDFNYQQAKTWFQNMDKLIHYSKLVADQQLSNSRDSSHILNSRHAQYDGGVGLPIKDSDEDFFPYGDG
ncbi:lysosomal alpha-mannosidase, putative, partial [Perkinsus marinus ATCC 50983]